MNTTKIGISGINATDNPGPGVAVARGIFMGENKSDLIGLSYDVHDPGNYMTDLFVNSYLLPYPSGGWDSMKSALLAIKKQQGLDILIPCLDAELPILIQHQGQLQQEGVKTLLPTLEQFELRTKSRLSSLVKELKVCKHPKTEVIYSIDDLNQVLSGSISLPAVIKGNYYKAYIVNHMDSAVARATEIASEWGFPLLVQELVSGQEVNLVGLCNEKGRLVGQVSIKKHLCTSLGKVWTAVSIQDQRLTSLCEEFCKFTQWKGPFEIECISNSNGLFLIEVNPRFPAWVSFATALGVNLPQRLVDLIEQGDCETHSDYACGKYLARYTADLVADRSYFENLLSKGNREGQ